MNIKYRFSPESLREAVESSKNVTEVLRKLGIKLTGGSHSHLSKRIKKEKIDTSHFLGSAWNVGKRVEFGPEKLSATDILVVDRLNGRREPTFRLRRALIEVGVKHECNICGLPPEWNGKPLTLQINHKNSNQVDNRQENLEFICGNCHLQFTDECRKTEKSV